MPRLALISDQHGNDVAFAAAVADIERVGVDRIVCLGDVAQGGPQPAETLDRLRALGCRTVLGNSDAFLLDPNSTEEPITSRQLEVRAWTLSRLDSSHLELLRSFEPTVEVELDSHRVLCFHGSPRSYDEILIPEHDGASLDAFRGTGADLLAGGHTHKQWTRTIDGVPFLNPGSVCLAYDHHQPRDDVRLSPCAEYAIVFADELGLGVEFRRVPYAVADVVAAVEASGRPLPEDWTERWDSRHA